MERADQEEGLRAFAESTHQTELESIEIIEKLAQTVDAARLFVAVIVDQSFGPAELMSEITHGSLTAKFENLAYHLFPFFGASNERLITPWQTNECIEALERLFTFRGIGRSARPATLGPAERILEGVRRDARIVRGSAYPEQTAEEIVSIQGRFENWFAKRTGIGPVRAQAMLWSIINSEERALNELLPEVHDHADQVRTLWRNARNKSSENRDEQDSTLLSALASEEDAWLFGRIQFLNLVAPDHVPMRPDNLSSLDAPPTDEEWEALIRLVGLTTEKRKNMTDPLEVRLKPLFVLPDRRVVLTDISHALDVLWDEFERVAKGDARFFESYQRKKVKWLEDKVKEHLEKVFPASHIYRDLIYPDPDKSGNATAQLDAAVKWGPFLVLVEAKASQFVTESHLSDITKLRRDLKRNVSEAFDQARRAARYISGSRSPKFKEKATGRTLTVNKKGLRRIHLLTVSQHHLAGLATRLANLKELGLFRGDEYPLSMSVADLEIVTEFCEGPDVFLHYVERRLEIERGSENVHSDELDFFGAYLDTRLQARRLWEERGQKYDFIGLGGFSAQFDDWIRYKRGEIVSAPRIELSVPIEIKEVLTELRRRADDGARWIAFSLLGLSDRILGAIAQGLREARGAKVIPGQFRRLVFHEGDTVISIVAADEESAPILYQRTELRAVIEKYRRRAFRSVGLGIVLSDVTMPFRFAIWGESKWQYDEGIEKLIEGEPLAVPAPGHKLPGRNELCICGSGKKFKKCCERRFEEARRARQRLTRV